MVSLVDPRTTRRATHRSGIARSKSAVRAILTNPRYTGYQVWNRQRTDEVLLDVENVALGHTSKMRWNPADKWVFSEQSPTRRSSARKTRVLPRRRWPGGAASPSTSSTEAPATTRCAVS